MTGFAFIFRSLRAARGAAAEWVRDALPSSAGSHAERVIQHEKYQRGGIAMDARQRQLGRAGGRAKPGRQILGYFRWFLEWGNSPSVILVEAHVVDAQMLRAL